MTITLWHGFEHRWTQTSHRVNRLGSWLRDATTLGHSGASGAGSDQLSYGDRFLSLKVEGVSATYGSVSFELRGTRGQTVDFKKALTPAKDATQVTVPLLAGFDLYAMPDGTSTSVCAAKLRKLVLTAEGEGHAGASTTTLNVSGSINLDCRSADCCGGDNWHYQVVVYYQILSAPAGEVAWAPGTPATASYSFNRATELTASVAATQHATVGGALGLYVSGLRSIRFTANRDTPQGLKAATVAEGLEITKSATLGGKDTAMHLLQLDLGIKDATPTKTGMDFSPQFCFKNWKPGMSLLSYRDGGSVSCSLTPLNLGFVRGGVAKAGSQSGTLLWVGGDKVANGKEGMVERTLKSLV